MASYVKRPGAAKPPRRSGTTGKRPAAVAG
jgi:hypothetical protein